MSDSSFRVRRAIVDDVDGLRALWTAMGYPTDGLERRITEFQVATGPDGRLLGALGLEISGRHGRLHGEAFVDFAHADELRAQFWQRLKLVAGHYGVACIWTEETAPFWRQEGFNAPNAGLLEKLPEQWRRGESHWLMLLIWDEEAVEKSLTRELAQFKADEKSQTEKAVRRGKILSFIATVLAIILAVFVGIYTLRMLQLHVQGGR